MEQSHPLAVSPGTAARMLGIGRTSLYTLLRTGELPAAKLGSRTLLRVSDLQDWLEKHLQAAQ